MANPEHLVILKKGVTVWNKWRKRNPHIKPDLSGLNALNPMELPWLSRQGESHDDFSFSGFGPQLYQRPGMDEAVMMNRVGSKQMDLAGVNFDNTNLIRANLSKRCLYGASLIEANLTEALFDKSSLSQTCLAESIAVAAKLRGASLLGADLSGADFSGADLTGAALNFATLILTRLRNSTITGCHIFGASVWDVDLEGAVQGELVIHPLDKAAIQVDELDLAQFIYLLLSNKKIRQVIDTITSKVVLILGRFTPERKAVLDAIREELRTRNYAPVLFDFEKPVNRDLTETISTLAHMARFVIADITDAKSIPQELERIVPDLPSVPVQPLLLASQHEYGMFEHFRRYPWVLEPVLYENPKTLLEELGEKVIAPAEKKFKQQTNG